MSNLLKCDRCGEHYEPYEAKHSLVVVDKDHAWTNLLCINSLDLCKDCHNQLDAWFSHPNNEKTIAEPLEDDIQDKLDSDNRQIAHYDDELRQTKRMLEWFVAKYPDSAVEYIRRKG